MKAAQISEYGDPSVATVNEANKPSLTEGQVLVEVYAASLNPFDSTLRAGYMKETIPLQLPATLGGDIAGVIAEVSGDNTHVQVGDTIYGQASAIAGNSGAFAEYATTAAGQVAKMPSNIGYNEAASLVLVGVSALQGLTEHMHLQSGQKIFIHGGGGSIGVVAVQIAKHSGAYVATTATGDNIDYVKQLGADEVIDYKTEDFSAVLKDYDAVFDTVGGDDFNKSFAILKPGGIAVTMAGQPDQAKAQELGVTAIHQSTRVSQQRLDALRQLVEDGTVTPRVAQLFPLDQVKEAFEARESGTINGKVVIEIKPAS